ncbi:MAG TPA: outer membrane protein assembly factor BamE [Pseudomonas pachastrellae]|nr:outer membrane protein assembly factor BamE [Halopseudomonas pachastrellae]
MYRFLFLVFTALLLAGCAGNRIDYNRSSLDLAIGMTKAEVQSIMGDPRRTDVNAERERWIYWNPTVYGFTPVDNEQLAQDRLVVTFEGGKVSRWGKQTLADDIMENSRQLMRDAMPPAQ